MLSERLYLQICGVFVLSLVGFVLLASIAWAILGHDKSDSDLFRVSAALSEILIPSVGSDAEQQQKALDKLQKALDLDLTLYSEIGELIAFSGAYVELPELSKTLHSGVWVDSKGGTLWATKLKDGRYLTISIERIQLPGESAVFVIFLAIIAIGITIIIYPVIRHLTLRLERLQEGVQSIGTGHLGARVVVEGNDEVAQLARSFNEAAERIQTLVHSQQLLLANASHELRTPLARIRLGIEMLENSRTAERLKALQDDISELDILIEELMTMTRIDAGVGERDFESFDLMALVAEECSRYPDCDFHGVPISIRGDRRMVQSAIRNLVDNGLKHGKPPIEVNVVSEGKLVKVSVCDHGAGIKETNTDELFEPFQRGKGKQNVSGSGLGLALVKKIMQAHGGQVQLMNDHGLVADLIFPALKD
jgi:signal transduction histidine kinase